MGRLSEVGSCIKNTADRLRALLTITEVADEEAATVSAEMRQPAAQDHMLKLAFKLAVLMMGLSSTALYALLSANLEKNTAEIRLLLKLMSSLLAMTVHLCCLAMLFLISIPRRIRCLLAPLKTICVVALLLFIVSTVLAHVLVLRTIL